jgi:nucleotide-binding universal stress UspA family protein
MVVAVVSEAVMYENILIPTDGSADALKGANQGVGLAAALGATVHGLYVVSEGGNPWESTSMEDQQDRAEAYAEGLIDEVRELADDAGVEFVSEVRFGPRVYEQINEYVEEADIDLIAMGSGYHGEFGGLLGSTADKVLRTAHVPVLILKRELRESAE